MGQAELVVVKFPPAQPFLDQSIPRIYMGVAFILFGYRSGRTITSTSVSPRMRFSLVF